MPKAYVMVTGFDRLGENGAARMIYEVVLDGARDDDENANYGCQMDMDPSVSLGEHTGKLCTKVAAYGVERGYKMSTGDVIPHGLPILLDAQSYTDKANGMTSDRTAIAVEPKAAEAEQPSVGTRLMASMRNAWNSMVG